MPASIIIDGSAIKAFDMKTIMDILKKLVPPNLSYNFCCNKTDKNIMTLFFNITDIKNNTSSIRLVFHKDISREENKVTLDMYPPVQPNLSDSDSKLTVIDKSTRLGTLTFGDKIEISFDPAKMKITFRNVAAEERILRLFHQKVICTDCYQITSLSDPCSCR